MKYNYQSSSITNAFAAEGFKLKEASQISIQALQVENNEIRKRLDALDNSIDLLLKEHLAGKKTVGELTAVNRSTADTAFRIFKPTDFRSAELG